MSDSSMISKSKKTYSMTKNAIRLRKLHFGETSDERTKRLVHLRNRIARDNETSKQHQLRLEQ